MIKHKACEKCFKVSNRRYVIIEDGKEILVCWGCYKDHYKGEKTE